MKISVVIPLLNEAESLRPLHQQLVQSLSAIGDSYEIIYIDDGSDDGSFEILKELHQNHQNVKAIQFRRNFGKSAALAAAFSEVSGDIVFTLDADLQDDPAEIPRFLAKLDEGNDLVSGWKYPRLDPVGKTLPSKLYNATLRRFSGIKIHEFNSGFKAMRREVSDSLKMYGEMHRYVPVLAHWRGFKVAEIKVKHRQREFGKSKFGIERYTRGLFDFITVFFITNFTRRPLHFFGLFGGISFMAGLLIDAYLTFLWFSGELIGNRPLLTFGTLLIIIGMQFLFFGLLAEMQNFSLHSKEADYTIRIKLD
jgi:glycosyltransferase involved in cell wall biosynthesis